MKCIIKQKFFFIINEITTIKVFDLIAKTLNIAGNQTKNSAV